MYDKMLMNQLVEHMSEMSSNSSDEIHSSESILMMLLLSGCQ